MGSMFFKMGCDIMNRSTMKEGIGDSDRRYTSLFGCNPKVCSIAWDLLNRYGLLPEGGREEHLMWTLLFLKTYKTENDLAVLLGGIDEKTLRKWVMLFVQSLAELEGVVVRTCVCEFCDLFATFNTIFCHVQILLKNRYVADDGRDCLMSIDCTDCKIHLDKGTSNKSVKRAFWSFKFRNSGLRYEVGVCIKSGYIVWLHGPFPCGRYNDIMIFRHCLSDSLDRGERVECDDGYRGEAPSQCVVPKHAWTRNSAWAKQSGLVRARHEIINKRLKDYKCLKDFFVTLLLFTAYTFVPLLFSHSFLF